jgi:choice-of-anchor A domain-containing protein
MPRIGTKPWWRSRRARVGAWTGTLLLAAALAASGGTASRPVVAQRQACGGLGDASDFVAFAHGDFTAANTQIAGRVAAGGNVSLASYALGSALPHDPARVDLIVGGNLTATNGSVQHGGVTYGGTVSGQVYAAGPVRQAPPPFSFDDAFATLRERSAQWFDLPANGSISGPTYGVLTLSGSDPDLNVFAVTAARLQSAQRITVNVPAGSTTIVNVSGSSYTSAAYPTSTVEPESLSSTLLWNFPLATSVQIGPGLAWQGTVLAPSAVLSLPQNGQLNGQALAKRIDGGITMNYRLFAGCPPPPPRETLDLASLCTDPVTDVAKLRLRNSGENAREVAWDDLDSGQSGSFTAREGHDTFFDVANGSGHTIAARSGSTRLSVEATRSHCTGTIEVRKVVTGSGTRPPGPWTIAIEGDSGFRKEVQLADGESASVSVPGTYQAGSVPIGEVTGGYRYVVVEDDPLGGTASVDRGPITILDGQHEVVTVGNDFPEGVDPPDPEPPIPPSPQPEVPPGPAQPLPGPDLTAGGRDGRPTADLDVRARLPAHPVRVGVPFTVDVVIRNRGAAAAVGAVGREVPQLDPRHPNRVARILSVRAGEARCTDSRPVRCKLGTLEPGEKITIRVRAELLVPGLLRSVILATSTTPESNTTNNIAVHRVRSTRPPAHLRVAVSAPPLAPIGTPFRYRVVATSRGKQGAHYVRVCSRSPRGLFVSARPHTFRHRGRICRDFRRIRRGQRVGFTVTAVPAAFAAGRTLSIPASAGLPDRPRAARGRASVLVKAALFEGTG